MSARDRPPIRRDRFEVWLVKSRTTRIVQPFYVKGEYMLTILARKWWVLLINGIGAIIFGLMAFAWPGITLLTLVILYGIYCVVDGVTALMEASVSDQQGKAWGRMRFVGILSIAVGVGAFIWPGITTAALLIIIAIWAIVRGALEIIAAIELRNVIHNEWLLIVAGVMSILFGVALLVRPATGALAMVWLIGAFAIAHGLLRVALAFKLRSLGNALAPATGR
jgi:uncharacterized membrane protein HdeD (DUF308 family)